MKRIFPVAALVALVFASPFQSASPDLAALQRPQATAPAPASPLPGAGLPNEKDSVKFGVIGDTGTGGSAQYAIAKLLSEARARFNYEFVIMLGDNMYGGESPSDFVRKFERPYAPILNAGVKFYATLGNHDEPTQRYYKLFNMDGKLYYSFKAPKQDVRFFALESSYPDRPQIEWVEKELADAKEHWKIPYFHHPLYSSGERHGSSSQLREVLEPIFLRTGVSVVFAGHDHFYERTKPQKGIVHFVVGSGGQLRRATLARVLVLAPRIVILDEPTSGLDLSVQATVLRLLRDLLAELRLTYVLISHDLSVVREMCDRLAIMYLGRIVETAETARLFGSPVHPYTRMLLAAAPRLAAGQDLSAVAIHGEPPSPTAVPSGCAFRTRCPHQVDACAEAVPALDPLEADHSVACHRARDLMPAVTVAGER